MKSRSVTSRLTRAKQPLAPAKEIDTSGMTPAESVQHFIEQSGGLDRALRRLPPMRFKPRPPSPQEAAALLDAAPAARPKPETKPEAKPSLPPTPSQQWREELLAYKPRDTGLYRPDTTRYETIHEYDPMEDVREQEDE